jgi:hypothetical protein
MKGFLLGLVVAGLAFGGYLYWKDRGASRSIDITAGKADAGAVAKKKRKRTRGAARVARAGSPPRPSEGPVETQVELVEPEPEPVRLSAADLRVVAQGDDLGRPDVVKMDLGNDKELPRLDPDEIDSRFRSQDDAIIDCISSARPDQETYVPGNVTVEFRIQRTGAVRGVRVKAPAILQKAGLYSCIRKAVMQLRFPASGSSELLSYPFRLS